jgi:hypothetical protein
MASGPADGRTVTAKEPDNQLDALIVDVNGERKRVQADGSVDVVFGDLLTIVEASLLNKSTPVDLVDLVGFRSLIRGGISARNEVSREMVGNTELRSMDTMVSMVRSCLMFWIPNLCQSR